MHDKYLYVFEKLIGENLRDTVIYQYDSREHAHTYSSFHHDIQDGIEAKLGQLMRYYIFFYAYSEKEVVDTFEADLLNDLERAAKRALRERLPDRSGPSNGLHSELLLDLLLTITNKNITKLSVRTIFRQMTDNQEIKGFDGLHIIVKNGKKELWIGQAKMGQKPYCVRSIAEDINEKANKLYTSDQLYFIADKEKTANKVALDFLKEINLLSWNLEEMGKSERANKLFDYFKEQKISFVLPCLLAYESTIYSDHSLLNAKMNREMDYMIEKFDEQFKEIMGVDYKIVILFMPIRDLGKIREGVMGSI